MAAAFVDDAGTEVRREPIGDLPAWVAAREEAHAPRWVWGDTPTWYDGLLAGGIRVARCRDLRLCHAILRDSVLVADPSDLRAAEGWDAAAAIPSDAAPTLFELDAASAPGLPEGLDDAIAELQRQHAAVASARDPGRLRLLLAAESAGALVAAELRAAGLPWDVDAHDELLTAVLGPRPAGGGVPRALQAAADRVRAALGDPQLSLDSQPKLLRALHRAGIDASSTSKWELTRYEHPAIEPLLEYKRLARLLSANGWAWLDAWVHDGRFRPVYVPGGVVTGRWASSGGGALQLPRQLRAAVRADPGWVLVVADVAQLEPRVLAAMAGDTVLADAARGRDLYAGVVQRGAVQTRAEAKVAMLGAMYGATTGDSGRLVPALRRTFPRAMALVDDAARTGEDGGVVATRLGRTSPPPPAQWHAVQAAAGGPEATAADESRARRWAGDRGRFTRNFVVQGTAAEWALCWLADLRNRLAALPPVPASDAAPRSGPAFARRSHLALFLHDEVIVHAPAAQADAAAHAVAEAAASAGRLLFGEFPIDFPLDVRISESALKD
ncbi:bifunctional 3'-5' exonuclease/DNA polymerase [Microbacterium sp. zg.Y1090]|uniref:bifunctional 3'-5' exonuclease/DNA polymerase n=1 Tax=Microbacterium TaxID=33882 RepID=UPI00214ABBA6|nr:MULTISPECIES: bifunctional 3'-5' exonuclease/DNA polymerase [unclassified Microbacterium]MCR2811808.1 bifunctional 3'-5' exonuclease/DNA polymerase [Microbacterium sp. zg.Y1084]MCR2818754.1 bifunctional 3'-5' exonuclease/DNA polymerase [Microbacterium sp. zg.Y1090]MDL5486844.1 bifunctional 3'-5' exonuclease/DNA polymerase [Microbacterium sp. zg-Y1211]WIM29729.1 bifunctional 3'-5' exonuclease/DNA polymerase [Microbacterium sp. zg-Y1090]